MALETCDQSNKETWPDQQKANDKDKYNDKDNKIDIYDPWLKSDRDSMRNSCDVFYIKEGLFRIILTAI